MQGLISGIKLLMSWVCTPIGLSVIAILVLLFIKDYYEYKKSSYYSITHNSYSSVNFDIGKKLRCILHLVNKYWGLVYL